MSSAGLEAVFLANREKLVRFLAAHGAGEAAEDLLHELWIKVSATPPGPVASPLSYLYRAANNLIIDRHRSVRQSNARERHWNDAHGSTMPGKSDEPSGERVLIARDALRVAETALAELTPRARTIFRRHRIEGVGQKQIAVEMGLSISTVESDLRAAYRALLEARKSIDEA